MKKSQKIFAVFLSLLLCAGCLGLTACGKQTTQNKSKKTSSGSSAKKFTSSTRIQTIADPLGFYPNSCSLSDFGFVDSKGNPASLNFSSLPKSVKNEYPGMLTGAKDYIHLAAGIPCYEDERPASDSPSLPKIVFTEQGAKLLYNTDTELDLECSLGNIQPAILQNRHIYYGMSIEEVNRIFSQYSDFKEDNILFYHFTYPELKMQGKAAGIQATIFFQFGANDQLEQIEFYRSAAFSMK